MNKDIKNQWINALRSGSYKQTKRSLHTNQGYCCLGVLCDISKLGDWVKPLDPPYPDDLTYLGQENYLPKVVVDWAGLEHYNPRIPIDPIKNDSRLVDTAGSTIKLSMLNDAGFSFTEIADLIERYL